MKYNHKIFDYLEIVDAFKWTGDVNQTEEPIWICEAIKSGRVRFETVDNTIRMLIKHPFEEIDYIANLGDYIMINKDGSISSCTSNYFEKNYEPISDLDSDEKIIFELYEEDPKDRIVKEIREHIQPILHNNVNVTYDVLYAILTKHTTKMVQSIPNKPGRWKVEHEVCLTPDSIKKFTINGILIDVDSLKNASWQKIE